MDDYISRQAAIDALMEQFKRNTPIAIRAKLTVETLPSAQPYTDEEIQKMQDLEQAELDKAFELGQQDVQPELSDAYMKAVWTWLIDYQVKAAELQGRYTPYEVLGWVANDWRKEHGQTD